MTTRKMKWRIIKIDKSLGKKVGKVNIPADLRRIGKKIKKPLLGIGRWSNSNTKFICFYSPTLFFIEEKTLKEIKEWMEKI